MSTVRAAHARNLMGPLIRATYRIQVRNVENLPRRGAVLIVCDWNNIAAPTVLKAGLPRPIHVWTAGPSALPGPLLSITGDLAMPEERPGVRVVREAVSLLEAGEVVAAIGVPDIGYALARSGAPILVASVDAPVTKRATDPPARKSLITLTLGPLHAPPGHAVATAPTRSTARAAAEWARQTLVDESGSR